MMELLDRSLNGLTMDHINTMVDEFMELQKLMNSGQGGTARAMKLHSKLFHMRSSLMSHIRSLPAKEQFMAYFLIGEKAEALEKA